MVVRKKQKADTILKFNVVVGECAPNAVIQYNSVNVPQKMRWGVLKMSNCEKSKSKRLIHSGGLYYQFIFRFLNRFIVKSEKLFRCFCFK